MRLSRFTKSRRVRYILFAVVIVLLVAGNVSVHIASIQLSEGALRYEREIAVLKRSNMKLEAQILSQSSLQSISTFAKSQGYTSSGPAVRWMDPVIASR